MSWNVPINLSPLLSTLFIKSERKVNFLTYCDSHLIKPLFIYKIVCIFVKKTKEEVHSR